MRPEPAFFWFTRGGRAYLVDDAASLARVGELHARRPRREPAERRQGAADRSAEGGALGETLGQGLRELAEELLRTGVARPADRDAGG